MDQKFECKFCGTKFHRENTLSTHICVKKQRNNDVNTAGFRYGFRTFQRYYILVMQAKKVKTQEEFIDSQYYIDFVKFGNHIDRLKPLHIEQYIDFVILSPVGIKKWTSDAVYELYIENLIKTEPPNSAVERTITFMIEWCKSNGAQFDKFFSSISPNEAAYLIKIGRISPWVLYLSSTGENLMSQFNEDHAKMISQVIDPGFWMRTFKKKEDDVDEIREILEQAGL